MENIRAWISRRRVTFGLALFFTLWFGLELIVYTRFGLETAEYWFYWEKDRFLTSFDPGLVLSPISHELDNFKHILGNVLFLVFAGSVVETEVKESDVFLLVVGFAYLSTLIANITAPIHEVWGIVGASGGIYSLISYGGAMVILDDRELSEGDFIYSVSRLILVLIAAYALLSELKGGGNIAHIVGWFCGLIFYMMRYSKPIEYSWR
ncbi:rhomboid family intramembrane serine protease [Halococcoides cellulosivorans]|uniref:Peptidase S54 rhomboid domain-containing protein n=1 Tax=Halococcoides cellulosivorans TaxID=1679096 RepID=A0A2R4X3W1_9EURY|nr:rhomboid family intramembrane serine protease [Halococcoides cellulosivorans]AWB28484.1 hypothetical protein HARCEL1_12620 [Halococcoides cellulosivorans]